MESKKSCIIYKQLIINNIRLPEDMIMIIKDFAFNTYETVMKRKRKELMEKFRTIFYSRITVPFIFSPISYDPPERWAFIINDNKKKVISGYNCYICGNYVKYKNNYPDTNFLQSFLMNNTITYTNHEIINNLSVDTCSIYCICDRMADEYALYVFF